jgi:hypothetical protein
VDSAASGLDMLFARALALMLDSKEKVENKIYQTIFRYL